MSPGPRVPRVSAIEGSATLPTHSGCNLPSLHVPQQRLVSGVVSLEFLRMFPGTSQ